MSGRVPRWLSDYWPERPQQLVAPVLRVCRQLRCANFYGMHFGLLFRRLLLIEVWVSVALAQSTPPGDSALPDGATVMKKVIQRAQDVGRADEEDKYCYEKRSVDEELDASGRVTKTTEEDYEVFPILGVPYSRLVKIQGRELTEKETRDQNREEEEFRKRTAEQQSKQSSTTNTDWLDQSVVDRFAFQVEGRGRLQDRQVLVLSFHPKPNRGPEKTITDKVLNRLAGTLWVDEAESEIAQVKLGLTADLSLGWFGMVGSLKRFDLTLERARLTDGVWVDRKQTLLLFGRKLFSPMRFRTTEESSNFRKP